MYHYRLYGMNICSDLEFSQLCVGDCSESQVSIRQGKMPADVQESSQGQYFFGPERSWLHNRTAWILAEGGNRLTYQLKDGASQAYLQTYLLGYGMSMLAMQQGRLAMHCSAVRNSRGAVLISGESGSGKSTLTTQFLQHGYQLMADDLAVVLPEKGKRPEAYPAFPFQKLCRDAALDRGYSLQELRYINEDKDKFLVPYQGEFSCEPAPVLAMLILGKIHGNEIAVRRLCGMEKFYAVGGNLFLRKLLGADRFSPRNGEKYLDFAAETEIFFIGRPEGKNTLSQVTDRAFQCLEGL